MQESFIYCGGFVECQPGQAELHSPEFPPGYVSRATSKIPVRDLKDGRKAATILFFIL